MNGTTLPRIGWYGLGSMGRPMAENLQTHLASTKENSLVYYNRTISSGATLASLGGIAAESFTDLVSRCDLIFTMVANDTVLEESIQSIANDQASNKIFVDCSTVHPDTAEKVSGILAQNGGIFLSAPVFGGPTIAATGKLVFAIGGPSHESEIAQRYILNVMGRKIIDCGDKAQNASLLKIGGNIITLNLMEAVGEAQVFAEQTGLGTGAMQELIAEGFGPVAGGYSQRYVMTKQKINNALSVGNLTDHRLTSGIWAPSLDTRPGFGVSLAIKDARHALSIASQNKINLPGLEIADKNMQAAREYGGECLDSSSMYGTLRMDAGLEFWNETSRQGGK